MVTTYSSFRPVWTVLYAANSVHAVSLGLYARRRHKFRRDFTYNKFHFGVFTQLASAFGIAAASKLGSPLIPGLLFLAAIGLVSFPAYSEGFREIRNKPDQDVDESGLMRRAGIYCLLAGWGLIVIKRRSSIPFLPPKMKNLL